MSILCASPLAKGLFRAAICQSGASFYPYTDKRIWHITNHSQKGAEQQGVEFQKHLNAKSLEQMRKMRAETLVDDSVGFYGFWPCVDGYVITDDQYRLYEKGEYNDVPVILMSNSDEGVMFSYERDVDEYHRFIQDKYGKFADELLSLYPARTRAGTFTSFADIWRDAAYAWPAYAWACLQSAGGKSPVYMAYLSQWTRPSYSKSSHRRGASHVDEMFYLGGKFKTLNRKKEFEVEAAMGEIMQQYWANFAKTADPNAPGLPYWPPFDRKRATTMEFDHGARLVTTPNLKYINFWERFFEWKRKELKNRME